MAKADIASRHFEECCANNEVKPTSMKAEWYMLGHIKGQQYMIEKAWEYIKSILEVHYNDRGSSFTVNAAEAEYEEFKQAMEDRT